MIPAPSSQSYLCMIEAFYIDYGHHSPFIAPAPASVKGLKITINRLKGTLKLIKLTQPCKRIGIILNPKMGLCFLSHTISGLQALLESFPFDPFRNVRYLCLPAC